MSDDSSNEPAHVKPTKGRKEKITTPAARVAASVPEDSFLNIMEFAGTRGAVAFSTTARKEKTLMDVKLRCRIGVCILDPGDLTVEALPHLGYMPYVLTQGMHIRKVSYESDLTLSPNAPKCKCFMSDGSDVTCALALHARVQRAKLQPGRKVSTCTDAIALQGALFSIFEQIRPHNPPGLNVAVKMVLRHKNEDDPGWISIEHDSVTKTILLIFNDNYVWGKHQRWEMHFKKFDQAPEAAINIISFLQNNSFLGTIEMRWTWHAGEHRGGFGQANRGMTLEVWDEEITERLKSPKTKQRSVQPQGVKG